VAFLKSDDAPVVTLSEPNAFHFSIFNLINFL